MNPARLITIPFSHYCEKARWTLDATGLDYREEPHAPVAHRRATRAVGGTTVPVLVHGERVVRDSTDIAHYADGIAPPERRLIPAEGKQRTEVLALEDEIDETIGVEARRVVYWHMLRDDETARAFVGRAMGIRWPVLRGVVASIFRRIIFRNYRVNAENASRGVERVRAVFARLGPRVERGGYLVEDRFTLADLTLAALAAPLLAPPEHPVTGKNKGTVPEELSALRAELGATPAVVTPSVCIGRTAPDPRSRATRAHVELSHDRPPNRGSSGAHLASVDALSGRTAQALQRLMSSGREPR